MQNWLEETLTGEFCSPLGRRCTSVDARSPQLATTSIFGESSAVVGFCVHQPSGSFLRCWATAATPTLLFTAHWATELLSHWAIESPLCALAAHKDHWAFTAERDYRQSPFSRLLTGCAPRSGDSRELLASPAAHECGLERSCARPAPLSGTPPVLPSTSAPQRDRSGEPTSNDAIPSVWEQRLTWKAHKFDEAMASLAEHDMMANRGSNWSLASGLI